MSDYRESKEQRLFGAMLVVSSTRKGGVLAIKDLPKVEVSTGTKVEWWRRNENEAVLGFPGGGRSENKRGKQETVRQTITNETREELSEQINIPYNSTTLKVEQQPYPFVVGQLKPNVGINQFGATSLHVPFEEFSRNSQKAVNIAVENKTAFWVPFTWVLDVINSLNPQDERFNDLKVRPQFLCAAMIWYLQIHKKLNIVRLQRANSEVIQFINTHAQELSLPVRNGAFSESGVVKIDLPRRDLQFLGLHSSRKQ